MPTSSVSPEFAQRQGQPDTCRLVSLPQVPDRRGNLTALEELIHTPFRFGSVRWFYDLPGKAPSAIIEPAFGDALVVALSGSFDVCVGGHRASGRAHLMRASIGLHVPAGAAWRVENPSTNSVGLVISSERGRRPPGSTRREDQSRAPLSHDSTVDDCHIIALRHASSPHASTTAATPNADVPFEIPRVYYLYDVPGGASRGGHAHRGLEQVLVAVAGSFDVELSDGCRHRTIRLDRTHLGAYIAPGIWRELRNFSSGAICLTLASAPYDESDYIRDYAEFRREKRL
jgi:hypothetical protein